MALKPVPVPLSHAAFAAALLADPETRAEYERLQGEEMPRLDAILSARREAGLTQAEVAERMGTKAPAVARLEQALISGRPSPSLATLNRYARALGKRLDVRLI
ncbi:XRE family transcriptional regulator [Elstera litoralis]|uniref:XRE family transcriptional regulator n=1 Tax=Elstera litoralis TaxID=552518 RepID=A0A0F3IUQ2_9PROT|nr:helix-turn-helix transcriptional regulator [Elstera litoralis]KJV10436.1 XRE family transcriptional regulator [Elstera litoralis]